MTLNYQSFYCVMRILLKAHESQIISVRGYDRETENQVQHFNLRKKIIAFRRNLGSNAITSLPHGVFGDLTYLQLL